MKINYNLDKYECIIELQTSKMANRQLKEIGAGRVCALD